MAINSLVFTGSTTYGTASDTGFPTGAGHWTIAGWFKTTVVDEANSIERFILAWGTAAAKKRADAAIYDSNGSANNTKVSYDDAGNLFQGNTTLSINTWYHFAITYDGVNVHFYLNGSSDSADQASAENITLGGTCSVGTPFDNLGNASFTWNGKLCYLAVFPSVLSTSNISGLAAGTTDPGTLSPDVFWKGTEGSGTSVADSGSLNATMTLHGGVGWSTDIPSQLSSPALSDDELVVGQTIAQSYRPPIVYIDEYEGVGLKSLTGDDDQAVGLISMLQASNPIVFASDEIGASLANFALEQEEPWPPLRIPQQTAIPWTSISFSDDDLFASSRTAQIYYVRNDGHDTASGLNDTNDAVSGAWLTVSKAQSGPSGGYITSDQLYFDGIAGVTFSGNLQWTTSGTQTARCIVGGLNGATISCGNSYGVQVYDCEFVTVQNLIITGSGVTPATGATSSTRAGIWLYDDRTSGSKWRSVWVTGCTVSGCQDGFWITTQIPYTGSATAGVGFANTVVYNCTAHDCQQNGFLTWGQGTLGGPGWPTNTSTFAGVYFGSCGAYNIYGRTTGGLHGSWGAVLNCAGAVVERCWMHDCNQNGSGDSSGMVTGYSSNVVFQACEVWHAFLGCGIDLDVSTTNCVVQYCFTHENDGAGLLDFASNGSGNIFQFNISRNDCLKTAQAACAVAHSDTSWNNNTIIGDANLITGGGVLIQPADGSTWRNNVFVGNNSLQIINAGAVHPGLYGNLYWPGSGGTLNLTINSVTYSTLSAFQAAGYEKLTGILFGVVADPLLSNPTAGANTAVLPGAQVSTITYFDPASNSPTIGAGLTPEQGTFNPGFVDFHGWPYRTGPGANVGAVSFNASSLVPTNAAYGDDGVIIVGQMEWW